MTTPGYNDIEIENWTKYENIKTNTFWDSSINYYEQFYKRYTKNGDNILLINCHNDKFDYINDSRNILNINLDENNFDENVKNNFKKLQLLVFNCLDIDIGNCKTDFRTAKNIFEKYLKFLEDEHFAIFISGDFYNEGRLKLLGCEQVKELLESKLTLKANIVVEHKNKSKLTSAVSRYRALQYGFNTIDYFNIFVMQKI